MLISKLWVAKVNCYLQGNSFHIPALSGFVPAIVVVSQCKHIKKANKMEIVWLYGINFLLSYHGHLVPMIK